MIPTLKVLVVEAQAVVRDLLVEVCGKHLPTAVVTMACNGEQGRSAWSQLAPDLVLLDLVPPDGDGLGLMIALLEAPKPARVIVFSGLLDEFTVHRATQSKLHGFVDKYEEPLTRLAEAIHAVLAGSRYFSPAVRLVQQSMRADPMTFAKLLSDREQELLGYFGLGRSNEEVAELQGLSAHTVKIHRRNIMGKLNLHSTPQLIRYAMEKGFVRFSREGKALAVNTGRGL